MMTPRKLIEWTFAVGIAVVVVLSVVGVMVDFYLGEFPRLESLTKIQSPVINSLILVSFAALISTLVVFFIRSSRGSLEFSLLGLKFRGPSGPITLWVLTFLVIVLALSTFLGSVDEEALEPSLPLNEYYSIKLELDSARLESEKFEILRSLFSNSLYQSSLSEPFDWSTLLYQYTHIRLVIDDTYLSFRSKRDLRISLKSVSDYLYEIETQISNLYGDNLNRTEWIIDNGFNKADFIALPSILNSPSKESLELIEDRLRLIQKELKESKIIDAR